MAEASSGEALSEQWRALDLWGKRRALDAQATALADSRDASHASRKRLVRETGDFRKLPSDDAGAKLQRAQSLVKLYQDEIDALTRRCKAAEAAFGDAFRAFAGVPDAAPALAALADAQQRCARLGEAELENRRLREELSACRDEFRTLQNQDVTLRRLEAALRDAQVRADDAARAREAAAADAERAERDAMALRDALAEREAALAALQAEASRAVRASHDSQATLLNVKAACEAQLAAKQSEVAILTAELERSRSARAAAAAEGASPSSSPSLQQLQSAVGAEAELRLAQQEIETARLQRALAELEQTSTAERQTLEQRIAALRAQLDAERAEKEAARNARPSEEEYVRLVNELETFKALVGDSASAAASALAAASSDDQMKGAPSAQLQAMADKSRRLESEAIRLRTRGSELEGEVAQLRKELATASEECSRMRSLVDRLEEQLSHGTALGGASQQQQQQLLPFVSSPQQHRPSVEIPQASSAAAVLEIVCGQRDRFRTRIVELEAEKSRTQDALERADAEVRRLKADNLRLYERIKYLQAYDERNAAGGPARQRFEAASTESDGDVERKYGQLYDETMNPFAVFNRTQREQRYKQLTVAERLLLRSTSFFLANRYTRLGFVGYALVLHFLVFICLYMLANSDC